MALAEWTFSSLSFSWEKLFSSLLLHGGGSQGYLIIGEVDVEQ